MAAPKHKAPENLTCEDGETIAYRRAPGKGPWVVFLGGFRSDMESAKALEMEAWCRAEGRAFLRFDYTGHGLSSGDFKDGTIGRWADDAAHAIEKLCDGPVVLVGSSMGGWIMLLVARRAAGRVRGLLGLSAAPDFTEDLIADIMTDAEKAEMAAKGFVESPNDYDPDDPYIITRALIEDGRQHLLLRQPLDLGDMPVRLIHGLEDTDVPWKTALKIQKALTGTDVEVQLVKNAGHRLSEPADIKRLIVTLNGLIEHIEETQETKP